MMAVAAAAVRAEETRCDHVSTSQSDHSVRERDVSRVLFEQERCVVVRVRLAHQEGTHIPTTRTHDIDDDDAHVDIDASCSSSISIEKLTRSLSLSLSLSRGSGRMRLASALVDSRPHVRPCVAGHDRARHRQLRSDPRLPHDGASGHRQQALLHLQGRRIRSHRDLPQVPQPHCRYPFALSLACVLCVLCVCVCVSHVARSRSIVQP